LGRQAGCRSAIMAVLSVSENLVDNPVEVEVWAPDPDRPRHMCFVRVKSVQEVFEELKARLEADGLLPDVYFTYSSTLFDKYPGVEPDEILFPNDWWQVVCYATRGPGSISYVHVGIIQAGGEFLDLYLGKTLEGLERALEIANRCTIYFEG